MAKDANKTKKEKKVKDKSFFKELRAELKKVVWPTPKRLVNNTAVVIAMILITTAIVFCLDVVFDHGYQAFVNKSQAVIQQVQNKNSNETSEEATNETSEETSNVTEENATKTDKDTKKDSKKDTKKDTKK